VTQITQKVVNLINVMYKSRSLKYAVGNWSKIVMFLITA